MGLALASSAAPITLRADDPPLNAGYPAWMKAADEYRKAGNTESAVHAYRVASGLALDKGQAARALYFLGTQLEKNGDSESALKCYKDSLARARYKETEDAVARLLGERAKRVTTAAEIKRALRSQSRSQILEPSVDLFVHFDLNSDRLQAPSGDEPGGLAQIREIALVCKDPAFSGQRFLLEGHTDLTPYRGRSKDESARLNMDLSLRRAKRVVETLIEEFDIPASSLEAQGLGQTVPIKDDDSEEAGRLNRRVELKVLGGSH
jgi:outer membrane protein OmpA-like peptidoglycan-associated protein